MEVRAQSFGSRLDCSPQALTEMSLDCMDSGEQEFSQVFWSTQDWFTIENTSYQAPSGTSSLWSTNDLLVSCNYTSPNLVFTSESSIESQCHQLDLPPSIGQTNFINNVAQAEELPSLAAMLNDDSSSAVTSRHDSLSSISEDNAVSPKSSSTSSPTRQVKRGTAPARNTSRKRGRPRKDCSSPENLSPIARRRQEGTRRIPHNEVEKKYREGLNASFRKLQCAVPELSQLSNPIIGTARPSKAVVIDSAIQYIHRLEEERDKARFLLENARHFGSCMSEDAFPK